MRPHLLAPALRRSVAAAVLSLCLLGPRLARAEDLTLKDVIRLALARNERARIARLSFVSADAAVRRARAAFLPSVSLGAGESFNVYPYTDRTGNASPSNSANGSLSVNQPLLAVASWPLYSAAKHSREAARHSEIDARRQLTFDAAKSYFGVIAQQRVLAAARGRLERAEVSLRDTRARSVAQLASSNDVTRAELERASAAQTVVAARNALEQARVSLEYLIDTPLPATLQGPEGNLEPSQLDVAALAARALGQRPDLAAARESAAAAARQAEEPRLRFVPTLGASAQLKVDQRGYGDRYWDTGISVTLSWSIWDAGVRAADEASRQAAAETARFQVSALKRRVRADVRAAAAALVAARATLATAEAAVTAARRSAEETSVLYKQGLAKAIELVDATLSRFNSELNLAGAQLGLRQAELDLRSALGLFPLEGVR